MNPVSNVWCQQSKQKNWLENHCHNCLQKIFWFAILKAFLLLDRAQKKNHQYLTEFIEHPTSPMCVFAYTS